MGETLKRRVGFLPVWVWGLLLVIVLALYLSYRKKQAAAAAAAQQNQNNLSSNLGTVPVSNLTTAAQPMPIQMGDTFVQTTVPTTVNASPTIVNNPPPSGTLQPPPTPNPSPSATALLKIGQAEQQNELKAAGGSVLTALSRLGLTKSQTQSLGAAVQAGGGNFLTENMARQQAGLSYYNAQGQLVNQ